MSQTEYGTGQHTNPADIPANIPRKDDWQGRMLDARERQIEGTAWYPRAMAPPETQVPMRAKAFGADNASLNVGLQPQCWAVYNVNVRAAGSPPQELWNANPGRDSVLVNNTGAVAIIISPTINDALNGIGVTIAAGSNLDIGTSGAGWVVSTGAAVTVQVVTTWFESPLSHQPPKGEE